MARPACGIAPVDEHGDSGRARGVDRLLLTSFEHFPATVAVGCSLADDLDLPGFGTPSSEEMWNRLRGTGSNISWSPPCSQVRIVDGGDTLMRDGSGSTQVAGSCTDHPRRRPPRQGRGRDRLARAERQPARQRGRAPAGPPDDRRARLPAQLDRAQPVARAHADDRRGGAVLHEQLGARAAARRRRPAPRPRRLRPGPVRRGDADSARRRVS